VPVTPDGMASNQRQHDGRDQPPRRGRGRGRGGAVGDRSTRDPFQSHERNEKTLVVERIPHEFLSMSAVKDWFSKFGSVTNVAVDSASGKALVSFENNEQARAAWKSQDAVFNNRIVKLFWHRPLDGKGKAGASALAASASAVQGMNSQSQPSTQPGSSNPSVDIAAATAKRQALERRIAEQKVLMARLEKASAEEKKEIMARLRKLNEEETAPTTSTPTPTPVTQSRTEDREKLEREKLDRELDLHSAESAVTGSVGAETNGGEDETSKTRREDLLARVAALRSEVCCTYLMLQIDVY
jgi:RNA-binding protein 26